jgi:hypothetical protein
MTFNPMKQELRPITKPPKTFELGSFDIEGVGGPGGFISGAVMVNNQYFEFDSPALMLDFMRRREFKGYRFAAHNLAYDYGILEPYMLPEDYPLLLNGRPFKVSIARGLKNPRFLVDSLLFAAGLSLKNLGQSINLPKLDTPPSLLPEGTFVPEWSCEKHNRLWCIDCYLKRDVEIVQTYMEFFQRTINELGGEMKFTLASTAMDLFRRKYLKDTYKTPFEVRNEYARNAYYGGRVEPFRIGQWDNVNGYDINSLYPFVMREFEYPNPNTLIGPLDRTSEHFIHEFEGVSEVTVTVPNCYIPPLPFRHKERLFFPVGTFRGYWTHVELRHALKLGAKINDIHTTLYSQDTCKPFINYVNDLYNLRQQYKGLGDYRELVIKIMLNSLYGKFGQRSKAGLQEIKSIQWWFDNGQPSGVSFRIIDEFVTVCLDKETNGQPDYINTLWASYVTSYARMTLYKYMLEADSALLYCDTDSIFTFNHLETSQQLGAMKTEYENVSMEVYGPKAYRLTRDGELIKVKVKGIPTGNREDYLENGVTTFMRPVGLLEAGHLNNLDDGTIFYPSMWREVTKREHLTVSKRCLHPVESSHQDCYLTVPHSILTLP